MTLFVVPISYLGLNVILGMEWMDLVSPVLWDYKRMDMTMWGNEKKVLLKGVGRDWEDLILMTCG